MPGTHRSPQPRPDADPALRRHPRGRHRALYGRLRAARGAVGEPDQRKAEAARHRRPRAPARPPGRRAGGGPPAHQHRARPAAVWSDTEATGISTTYTTTGTYNVTTTADVRQTHAYAVWRGRAVAALKTKPAAEKTAGNAWLAAHEAHEEWVLRRRQRRHRAGGGRGAPGRVHRARGAPDAVDAARPQVRRHPAGHAPRRSPTATTRSQPSYAVPHERDRCGTRRHEAHGPQRRGRHLHGGRHHRRHGDQGHDEGLGRGGRLRGGQHVRHRLHLDRLHPVHRRAPTGPAPSPTSCAR